MLTMFSHFEFDWQYAVQSLSLLADEFQLNVSEIDTPALRLNNWDMPTLRSLPAGSVEIRLRRVITSSDVQRPGFLILKPSGIFYGVVTQVSQFGARLYMAFMVPSTVTATYLSDHQTRLDNLGWITDKYPVVLCDSDMAESQKQNSRALLKVQDYMPVQFLRNMQLVQHPTARVEDVSYLTRFGIKFEKSTINTRAIAQFLLAPRENPDPNIRTFDLVILI